MDHTTSEALEASIEHWKENLRCAEDGRWEDVRVNGTDCPLCDKFFAGIKTPPCLGCPIQVRTGRIYCRGTPYTEVLKELEKCNRADSLEQEVTHEPLIAAVEAEIEFLESLRPPKET